MDHAVILVCTVHILVCTVHILNAIANYVMLQLYFDMIFITAFKIKYKLYSLRVSNPPIFKVKKS
jgi:hypothetical protein